MCNGIVWSQNQTMQSIMWSQNQTTSGHEIINITPCKELTEVAYTYIIEGAGRGSGAIIYRTEVTCYSP